MTGTTKTATRFFIAVPANPQADGIFGLGTTDDAAIRDAYQQSGTYEAKVEQDESLHWIVRAQTLDVSPEFLDESDARAYAASLGFVARACTERLYRHVTDYGAHVSSFGWTTNAAGLDDLEFDSEEFDAAVAHVEEGLQGNTSQADWKAEDALTDASAYVDAYVVDDEEADESLQDALKPGTPLRTAVNVAVRDILLETISELAAA